MKLTLLALAGASLFALANVGSAQDPAPVELKPGDQAPDFAMQGSDGKVHRLSDYRGRHVVLAWFPKAFTGG